MPTPRPGLRGERLGGASSLAAADPAKIIADSIDAPADLVRRITRSRPPWMRRAACARPEHRHVEFYVQRGQSVQPALDLCAACPVAADCRAWGLSTPDPTEGHGIAGGLTPAQRRDLRRAERGAA